jgi:endonuclease-3
MASFFKKDKNEAEGVFNMKQVRKKPFNISKMFSLIRKAIEPYPKATLFDLYDQGHTSIFEILMACVLSIRTLDETSLKASKKLFAKARTPEKMVELSMDQIQNLIRPCTFPFQKAKSILNISHIILDQYHGELPCNFETLTSLPGVGPKCANLVLGIVCGVSAIGVDVHVHRITNRWGYVHGLDPEETRHELERKLAQSKWIEINKLLVPFGKHICTGTHPKCPTCPVLDYCRQVGVNPKMSHLPETKTHVPVHPS